MSREKAAEILHRNMKDFCEKEKEYSDAFMTVEQILNDRMFEPIIKSMEQYDTYKQSVDFAIYATSQAWYNEDSNLWELHDENADPFRYSNEEMYNKFLKDQQALNEEG